MVFNFKKLDKKEIKIFITLMLFFMLFYAFRIASGNFEIIDCKDYLYTANLFSEGLYFHKAITENESFLLTKRPFLYPFFLFLVSLFNIKTILFIQTLFGIFNAYLLIQLQKKINGSVSYLLILFTVLTPSIFIYTQLIMSDWLVMTLIMLLSFLLLDDWNKKRFFYIQIITILLAFTRPVFYVLIYFNFIYFACVLYKKKIFSFSLLIPMLCLFLYLGLNNYRTGFNHFSSMENFNLIEFNLFFFKSKTQSIAVANKWKDSVNIESEKIKVFKAKSTFYSNVAKKEISEHFLSYSFYHFYTSIRGVFDPGRYDLMTFFKEENDTAGFLEALNTDKPLSSIFNPKYILIYFFLGFILLFQLIKLFSVSVYVLSKRNDINYLNFYLFLTILIYILLHGPVNCSRYMMPFQGLFIVIAIKYLQKGFAAVNCLKNQNQLNSL